MIYIYIPIHGIYSNSLPLSPCTCVHCVFQLNTHAYLYIHIDTYILYTYTHIMCIYIMMYPLVNKYNYGQSPFLMGESTIFMAVFHFAKQTK